MAENKGRQGGHGPGGPGARGGYQKPKDAKRTMLRLMKYISGKKWLLVIVFLRHHKLCGKYRRHLPHPARAQRAGGRRLALG